MALRQRKSWAVVTGAMVITGIAWSQPYPSKPIRILTSGAGGGGDFITRQVSPGLASVLGQPVVVDNRPGIFPAQIVARAAPDGYTLQVGGGATWIVPMLQKVPYDVLQDFTPISLLVREINVLVVHPSLPVKTVKELIALAKAKPGELNFSAGRIGTTQHLGMELFKSMAGINVVYIPHKAGAEAISGLLTGETQMMIYDWNVISQHVKAGKMVAIAATSAEPSPLVPGLPTVAQSGLPGYEVVGVTGMWAPIRTPDAIVKRLNQDVVRVLNQPDVREKFANARVEIVGSSPEQFGSTIKSEIARLGKVIREANIRID